MLEMSLQDQQKVLQLALQSLQIQQTLVENQLAETRLELRTLERDDTIEKLESQLILLRKDETYFQQYLSPKITNNLLHYYDD